MHVHACIWFVHTQRDDTRNLFIIILLVVVWLHQVRNAACIISVQLDIVHVLDGCALYFYYINTNTHTHAQTEHKTQTDGTEFLHSAYCVNRSIYAAKRNKCQRAALRLRNRLHRSRTLYDNNNNTARSIAPFSPMACHHVRECVSVLNACFRWLPACVTTCYRRGSQIHHTDATQPQSTNITHCHLER